MPLKTVRLHLTKNWQKRAEAVKKELVKRYGIAANRVEATGMGIGDLFDENSWNRVSVVTVNE